MSMTWRALIEETIDANRCFLLLNNYKKVCSSSLFKCKVYVKYTRHKYFIIFTFPRRAKFIFQLYACNLFEIYVVILQITFFTVILSHVPFLQKDKYRNGDLPSGSHTTGYLRCFDICKHDLEIGKLFSLD